MVAAPKPALQSILFGPSAVLREAHTEPSGCGYTSGSVEKTQSNPQLAFAVFHHVKVVLQPFTQLGCQRILDGFGQIGHGDLRRIDLPTGTAGSDYRDLETSAIGQQRRFGPHAVESHQSHS